MIPFVCTVKGIGEAHCDTHTVKNSPMMIVRIGFHSILKESLKQLKNAYDLNSYLSQSMIVLSLWAIVNTVRSANSRRIVC